MKILKSNLLASILLLSSLCTMQVHANTNTPAASLNQSQQAALRYNSNYDIFHPVYGKHGMVATEQELATQIGLKILEKGGNAVDAAVAVGFALAVVLPNAGNIGGGGFMVIHDAKKGLNTTIDFREMAPSKASRNMYLDAKGNVIDGKSLFTHQAVGVPGTVYGLLTALEKYGSLPIRDVLDPAIDLASNGFIVSESLADLLAAEAKSLGKWESTKKIFFHLGYPIKAGHVLIQRDLAHTLEKIVHKGIKGFYEGDVAVKIVREMKKHGGLISLADLKKYKSVERKPIYGEYRGYKIVTMPPPSSGGVHLVQILNLLERYPLGTYGHNSAKSIHYLAESMKYAYADRSEYLGDPAYYRVPVKGLISKEYANALAKNIKDGVVVPSIKIKPGKPQPYESDQTTHYSIVDKNNNAVAVTYTLNLNFGSGIVAEGTGVLLNNEMDDFSSKPGVPNAFGLIGGVANAIEPGKRPLSSMTPTIVLKDDKPFLVTGSPGGARIITTVLQSIINVVDYGMNPAEAIVAPRIHHQWLPDELRIEEGLSPDTIALLVKMGYKVTVKPTMGRLQIIQVTPSGLYGYSDPRNPDGLTLSY